MGYIRSFHVAIAYTTIEILTVIFDSLTVELSVHANSEIHKGVSDHGAISADLAESYEVRLEAGLFPRSEEARQKMARILDLVLPTLKRPTARGDTSEHLNLAEYEVRSC